MARILICDDEKDIVAALKIYLEAEGYETICCHNGQEALNTLRQSDVQLVLLDIMMPGMDGIETLTRLRKSSNVPVILLTAKSEDTDKILGLDVGADDYITKPFNPVEVMARIKSQLRRYLQLGGGSVKPKTMRIGGVEMDDQAKTVTVDGAPVALTPREYDILRLLMMHPDTVYSPSEIYRVVWEELPLNADNAVAVHIRHIREKIEINPSEPRYLQVVWGKGYKMVRQKGDQP